MTNPRHQRASSAPLSQLGRAALAYAARGFAVFPCVPGEKRPIVERGVSEATTNPAQIEKWWTANPNANVAFEPASAGMLALDFDPGSDRAAVLRQLGLPETKLRSRTPRGGTHEFYALADGEIVAPSASKLAPNVDVRSFQSYVLLPPSHTADGAYEWLSEGKPAYRTDELLRLANSAREKHPERNNWIIEPDLAENVAAAREWLRTEAKIAIEGQGGEHTALATAAMMRSYGLSEDKAFDLIVSDYNPRCSPPWSGAEIDHLRQKVENGYLYATSPPGNVTEAYRVASAKAMFTPVTTETDNGGMQVTVGRFRAFDRPAMETIQPPGWLIRDMLPKGGYLLLVGAPGAAKTFIAIDIAATVAAGMANDLAWEAAECGDVLFAAGEGGSELKKRVAAWEHAHLAGASLEKFVMINPVPSVDAGDEDLAAFISCAKQLRPGGYKLAVIDTVGRAMQGTNENAQEHASRFTKMVERLQRELGCAVLALHHTGHQAADRARGSSVFNADADTVLRLDREDKALAATLTMTKQKDAAEWAQPKVVRLAEVQLQPGLQSLTVMPATAAEVQRARASMVSRDETPMQQDINARYILAALHSRRAARWNKSELATEARRRGCKIPLSSLRMALGLHRGKVGWAVRHPALAPFYDIPGECWKSPVRDIDFPPMPPGYELDENVPLPCAPASNQAGSLMN